MYLGVKSDILRLTLISSVGISLVPGAVHIYKIFSDNVNIKLTRSR